MGQNGPRALGQATANRCKGLLRFWGGTSTSVLEKKTRHGGGLCLGNPTLLFGKQHFHQNSPRGRRTAEPGSTTEMDALRGNRWTRSRETNYFPRHLLQMS